MIKNSQNLSSLLEQMTVVVHFLSFAPKSNKTHRWGYEYEQTNKRKKKEKYKRVIIWSLKYQGTTYDNYLFIVIELSLATRFVTIMPVLLPLFYAQTTAKLIAKTHYGLDMHFVIQNRVKPQRIWVTTQFFSWKAEKMRQIS